MNILVVNDDGIESVGLKTLVKELSSIADVYVVAPMAQRSGYSHHITINKKIRFEEATLEYAKKAYIIEGTPADCSRTGLTHFFKKEGIDLVISGINIGPNVASDIIYSGTAGGARESHMLGTPAIAISHNKYDIIDDYTYCVDVVKKYINIYLNDPNKDKYFMNINVPNCEPKDVKGTKLCKTTDVVLYDNEVYEFEEDGNKYVNTIFYDPHCKKENDSDLDFVAVNAGYITISLIDIDYSIKEFYDKEKRSEIEKRYDIK